ncbi:tRNA pseudouridine(38-40) synthase TruA [Trichloromonas sp.]|uniref:tRNA pseudouridine(38-40) synthase TruA n=1 Tax=Trichloromonas sp. TaxID=3069249 RepID=UPI002A3D5973|nr:tRNA pseudouridine(38-40) synthase TruA [Trichloromonas sp.]
MKTIRLTIEYDGTAYVGWQIQANGTAVQQVLEEALAKVLGHTVRLTSSGRTDAGVHARGMVAHFRTERELPMSAYREGLNCLLPPDIAVCAAVEAAGGFHARFDARGKWYRYTLHTASVRSPLAARYAWHVPRPLDEERMRQGAELLVGRHDFAAFRTSGCDAVTTVREMRSVELVRDGELLHIDVRGTAFLRNMVRIMAGTLVEIGWGKMDLDELAGVLRAEPGLRAGRTAPPQGLCLMEVRYE